MQTSKSETDGINPAVAPSGTVCVECATVGGWWLHLRRCAECGHIGCCDSSPSQHASKHHAATGHPIITSFEPGERWFYDYRTEQFFAGPKLHAPPSRPLDQPVPRPAGAVPSKLLGERLSASNRFAAKGGSPCDWASRQAEFCTSSQRGQKQGFVGMRLAWAIIYDDS